ncbi:MAG: glycosyltransferase [Anaerolineae bacterium]|nr:glycosyltransferase [Anaerolineae bacterium]
MTLRYQLVPDFYKAHITQMYTRHPGLAERSYAEQRAVFWADGFNWANYLVDELPQYGYETQHIIANIEPMQKRWAQEHGITYREDDWYHDILLAQIKAFQPHILHINMSAEFIQRVREVASSLRLVVGWAGEPIVDAHFFRVHDLVLTCVPENVDFYRAAGLKSDHMDHAFYPAVLGRFPAGVPLHSDPVALGFIGNMMFGEHYHTQRAQLFHDITQRIDLTIYGTVDDLSQPDQSGHVLKRTARRAYYGTLAGLHRAGVDAVGARLPRYDLVKRRTFRQQWEPVFAALGKKAQPPVFGLDMYQLLSSFKICLNAHAWSAYASNMRLYEATGVGTCLLTDWKQNIADLFEPDVEVVTYRSAAEAADRASYLLDHENERQRIVAAGQARTLRDHTLAQRALRLDHILRQHL